MQQKEQSASVRRMTVIQPALVSHELVNLLPPGWSLEVPLARIITCGSITIEVLQGIIHGVDGHIQPVYGPPDAEVLVKKGTSTAFTLLALLASQPGCYAAKDWLSEKLGHLCEEKEDEDIGSMKRVGNVVLRLRHLLCSSVFKALPQAKHVRLSLVTYQRATGESGSGYRLSGTPLVWLDVEAIGEHVQRARVLEQYGNDGLAEWQAAYKLAIAGPFLRHEPYSGWALWRRQEIETLLWDCVQVLWRHYVAQGEGGETEALRILQAYWLQHVANEDALRPLLELLGKRECYGQAEEYYAQLCVALAREGKQPDRRTREIMDFLREATRAVR